MNEPIHNVVVVGASAAGLGAADGLREAGFAGTITVLSAERHHPYDRPSVSKDMLVCDDSPNLLALRSPDQIAEKRLDLRLGHAAVGLDIDRRYVVTTDGEALPWDAVVIACGSTPRRLHTVAGEPLPVLRTPDDLQTLRGAISKYREVTLIGSGLIGLEVAAGLTCRGISVTIFDALPLPLEPVVGSDVADRFRRLHADHGVTIRGGTTVEAVTGQCGDYSIRFTDGTVHRTPFVLAGIGVDAEIDWLQGSGVELDRGVATDAAGRTNVPGVWAAGDVATFPHPHLESTVRVEHWTHAVEQGRHVGLNIARGDAVPYTCVPYFWTDQYGSRFHCYGRRRPGDDAVVVEGSLNDDEYLVLFGQNGEFHAIFSCGRVRSLRGYRKLLARRSTWDEAMALAGTNALNTVNPAPAG